MAGLRIFHNNATLLSAYLLKDGQQLPIDPAAVYNVVTNNFMATGGDGYTTLQAGEQIYPTGPPQDEVLAAVISGTPGGVAPQVGSSSSAPCPAAGPAAFNILGQLAM